MLSCERECPELTIRLIGIGARSALAVDLEQVERKRLLVLGAVGPALEGRLEARGVRLCRATHIEEAIELLARARHDGILIDPAWPRSALLARALLTGRGLDLATEGTLLEARRRHAVTPIFALPFPGDLEYGVLLAPSFATVLRTDRLPVEHAILRLDLRRLLALCAPMA